MTFLLCDPGWYVQRMWMAWCQSAHGGQPQKIGKMGLSGLCRSTSKTRCLKRVDLNLKLSLTFFPNFRLLSKTCGNLFQLLKWTFQLFRCLPIGKWKWKKWQVRLLGFPLKRLVSSYLVVVMLHPTSDQPQGVATCCSAAR